MIDRKAIVIDEHFTLGDTNLPRPFFYVVVKMRGERPKTWNDTSGYGNWPKAEYAISSLNQWLGVHPLMRDSGSLRRSELYLVEWAKVYQVSIVADVASINRVYSTTGEQLIEEWAKG